MSNIQFLNLFAAFPSVPCTAGLLQLQLIIQFHATSSNCWHRKNKTKSFPNRAEGLNPETPSWPAGHPASQRTGNKSSNRNVVRVQEGSRTNYFPRVRASCNDGREHGMPGCCGCNEGTLLLRWPKLQAKPQNSHALHSLFLSISLSVSVVQFGRQVYLSGSDRLELK